jgi:hypothetical protein
LGDFDGEGKIYLPKGADFAYSVTVNKDTTSDHISSTMMKIKVSKAESILLECACPLPDLIKLDVETFEPEVLKGFGGRFPSDSIFLIEVLTNSNADKLRQFFTSKLYDFYNINDAKKTLRQTVEIEKSDFYNYLVIPKSRSTEFKFNLIGTPIT